VHTELIALSSKTGLVIGRALIDVVEPVLFEVARAAASNGRRADVLHSITGDGLQTNEKAMRHVLFHYACKPLGPSIVGPLPREESRLRYIRTWVRYMLAGIVCSAHTANLVVTVAIVGKIDVKVDMNEIVANVVRWYKYLANDYIEEFTASFRSCILGRFELVEGQPPAGGVSQDLLSLYGPGVLPPDVLAFFNGDLTRLQRYEQGVTDERKQDARGEAFRLLYKHCLYVDEKPIVTRFFTFGPNVWKLMLRVLLKLGRDAFSLSSVNPNPENKKRQAKFWAFMESTAGLQGLREAAISLRLSMLAISIAS